MVKNGAIAVKSWVRGVSAPIQSRVKVVLNAGAGRVVVPAPVPSMLTGFPSSVGWLLAGIFSQVKVRVWFSTAEIGSNAKVGTPGGAGNSSSYVVLTRISSTR